jgi:hypothetical protein
MAETTATFCPPQRRFAIFRFDNLCIELSQYRPDIGAHAALIIDHQKLGLSAIGYDRLHRHKKYNLPAH